jgi:disulfide bond formation protein DsbB
MNNYNRLAAAMAIGGLFLILLGALIFKWITGVQP